MTSAGLAHMGALRVACAQLNTRGNVAANVDVALGLVEEAADAGAQLLALPETWTYKGGRGGMAAAAQTSDGPANAAVARAASRHGMWLLAGSIYEPASSPGRFWNASALFGPDGDVRAVYRKIHLFDAVSDAAVYRESDDVAAGDEVVTSEVDVQGGLAVTVGLTICYDLRFPELYRSSRCAAHASCSCPPHSLCTRALPIGTCCCVPGLWRTAASSSHPTRWGSTCRAAPATATASSWTHGVTCLPSDRTASGSALPIWTWIA